MRRTLSLMQYTALTVAVVSLLIVLFAVSDTDVGPQAAPPPITLIFAVLVGVGALIGGLIQWIGIPLPEKDEKGKEKTARSGGDESPKKPSSD